MWQYLETVTGLCSGMVQGHVCAPQKNLLWRSQAFHTEEVKLIASPKWELDPREDSSFPSGHSVSELRLESRFLSPLSAGSCAHDAHRDIFSSKTNWWLLPPSRQTLSQSLVLLRNHRKRVSFRTLLVVSSYAASSWCYFSKSMAWLWESLVTDRHCDIPGNLWIPLWNSASHSCN